MYCSPPNVKESTNTVSYAQNVRKRKKSYVRMEIFTPLCRAVHFNEWRIILHSGSTPVEKRFFKLGNRMETSCKNSLSVRYPGSSQSAHLPASPRTCRFDKLRKTTFSPDTQFQGHDLKVQLSCGAPHSIK